MKNSLATAICIIGVTLVVCGLLAVAATTEMLPLLLALTGMATVALWLARWLRETALDARLRRAGRRASHLTEYLTPQLFGEYTPYVQEAARRLGEARDVTGVPALLRTLNKYVNEQPPNWREVAEVVIVQLGEIGDGRALPVLYNLENIRGIGVLPAIRTAIARIEPSSWLLRAAFHGSLHEATLLRVPLDCGPVERAILLRAGGDLPD